MARTRPRAHPTRFWQSVTDARGALADAWVHDGERYQLDRAKVNIDLDQLEQPLASTDPEHDDPEALETGSDSGVASHLKAPTMPGQTDISAAYAPPCSNYWSVPAAHACKAATLAARLKWPSSNHARPVPRGKLAARAPS
jgi:hypothetical protein